MRSHWNKAYAFLLILAAMAALISCSVTLESGIHGEYSPANAGTPSAKPTAAITDS